MERFTGTMRKQEDLFFFFPPKPEPEKSNWSCKIIGGSFGKFLKRWPFVFLFFFPGRARVPLQVHQPTEALEATGLRRER